jgi:hypothetical protein
MGGIQNIKWNIPKNVTAQTSRDTFGTLLYHDPPLPSHSAIRVLSISLLFRGVEEEVFFLVGEALLHTIEIGKSPASAAVFSAVWSWKG